jgi:hypothetical protein
MLRRTLLVALLFAVPALAKELKGVKMDDSVEVEGKKLVLVGMGLRTKVVFKVYVAGLYLEEASSDPGVILSKDQTRKVTMVMLRDLEKGKITEAIQAGFEKNNADKMKALQERLTKFMGVIPDLKEGQTLQLTYVPGKGTSVKGGGGAEVTVEGKDFADALFSVWLGKTPVDEDLKSGMLGKG